MNPDRTGRTEPGIDGPTGAQELTSRIHEWVFLTGRRWLLAGALVVAFFAVLVAIEYWFVSGIQQTVPLFYVSSAIIGGNFTLITIVISINQLVISRQLSTPGELEQQVQETAAYRNASAELASEHTPPPTPSSFLQVLLDGVRDSIHEFDAYRSEIADSTLVALDEVLAPLEEEVERSIQELERDEATMFKALVVTLNTNYSDDIHGIRRLQWSHRSQLTPDADDCLDTLVTELERIDVARQYLKTVYIQAELARLSRNLMYVGIPVILAGLGLMEVFVSTGEVAFSPRQLSIVTAMFVTLGAAPLTLLFAYVLRLSVVSQRTAAVTPFTTPTQEATPVEAITEDADD